MRTGALLCLLALVAAGCAAPASEPAPGGGPASRPGFGEGAAVGETRLFAPIGRPGLPEGIAVRDGRAYVTLSQDAEPTGEVLVLSLADASVVERIVVAKRAAAAGGTSRLLGLAFDAQGRLYVADTGDPRILRLDLDATPRAEVVHATIPDLPPCAPGAAPCSPTVLDEAPVPNYLLFGPDGALYVSDIAQAVVFRIPPGGGEAEVWFQDARLGNAGANGVALSPDGAFLYLAQTYVEGVSPVATGVAGGALHRLPFVDAPTMRDLELVRAFPRYGVDGIAFGASGLLYATMLGQAGARHGISVLAPDGAEVAFLPTEAQEAGMDTPYFYPASIAFDDARRSILVTNQAFARPDLWAVLETYVDDVALPLHEP